MQNRILLIIVVLLSVVYLLVNSSTHSTIFFKEKEKDINVLDTTSGKISNLNLEEYIIGVVAAEMPASFDMEALKAQAIASRTYAMYKISNSKGNYDVVTDVTNQKYITIKEMENKWGSEFNKYYEKIKAAVTTTKNKVLKYNDNIIEAYYFSMSNGYTEDVSLVFSEERDYLKSVESNYESTLKNFEVTKVITKDEFCKSLSISCNDLLVTNIKKSSTGRVNTININNKEFKGTEVRKLLNLRSTDFSIKLDGNNILVTTKGYGHGVGMSQYGAEGMAKSGKTYEEILTHYYKNTKIGLI